MKSKLLILFCAGLILIFTFFQNEALTVYEENRAFVYIVFGFLMLLLKPKHQPSRQENAEKLEKIANKYLWVRWYMVIYLLVLVFLIFYKLSQGEPLINTDSQYSVIQLLGAIFGIGLPFIIINIKPEFRKNKI